MTQKSKFYYDPQETLSTTSAPLSAGDIDLTSDSGRIYYGGDSKKYLVGESLDKINVGIDNTLNSDFCSATFGKGNVTGVRGYYIESLNPLGVEWNYRFEYTYEGDTEISIGIPIWPNLGLTRANITLCPYEEIVLEELFNSGLDVNNLYIFGELNSEDRPGHIALITAAGDRIQIPISESYKFVKANLTAGPINQIEVSQEIYNYKLARKTTFDSSTFPYQIGDKLSFVYLSNAKRYNQVLTVESINYAEANPVMAVSGIPVYDEDWCAASENYDSGVTFQVKKGMYNNCVYSIDRPNVAGIVLSKYNAAVGRDNKSLGHCGFAAGRENKVTCQYGAALGYRNEAGYSSFVAGRNNRVRKEYSGAFGDGNTVDSRWSAAFGYGNTLTATDGCSLAVGNCNSLSGAYSVVGGDNNNSYVAYSAIFGYHNTLSHSSKGGASSLVSGENNNVASSLSIVSGKSNTLTDGYANIVTGTENTVKDKYSIISGQSNNTSGGWNAVFGYGHTLTNTECATAFGDSNIVGSYSIAAGKGNNISAQYSTGFGKSNGVTGKADYAFVAGYVNNVIANANSENPDERNAEAAFALGYGNKVYTWHGVAIGESNTVTKTKSGVAIGIENKVSGKWATAFGCGLTTSTQEQVVLGRYNDTNVGANASVVIGSGNSSSAPVTGMYITNTAIHAELPIYENGILLKNKYAAYSHNQSAATITTGTLAAERLPIVPFEKLPLPTFTLADAGKVLGVVDDNGVAKLAWVAPVTAKKIGK
jgi:hypothetical protein